MASAASAAAKPKPWQLANEQYLVCWICTLRTEYIAAQVFLDEIHAPPAYIAPDDDNAYTLGRIGTHNVIIAARLDGEYGEHSSSALIVEIGLFRSFRNIRIGLIVRIGGGAPSSKHDIRLGDVVVGEVVSEIVTDEVDIISDRRTLAPPNVLLRAMNELRAQYTIDGHTIQEDIQACLVEKKKLRKIFNRPETETDQFHQSDRILLWGFGLDWNSDAAVRIVKRPIRDEDEDDPTIHYGQIAFGDTLVHDGIRRDLYAFRDNLLCFMSEVPFFDSSRYLAICGICDYSDEFKNTKWQGYAAMTAAAYAKSLLKMVSPSMVQEQERHPKQLLNDRADAIGTIDPGKLRQELLKAIRVEEIRKELSAPVSPTNFGQERELYQPGTGQWLANVTNRHTRSNSPQHMSSAETERTEHDRTLLKEPCGNLFNASPTPHQENRVEYLLRMADFCHFVLRSAPVINDKRVKVSLIDTGIDATHPRIARYWSPERNKAMGKGSLFRDFSSATSADLQAADICGPSRDEPVDEDGHGTFIAGLLLDLNPCMELSVARIGTNRYEIKEDEDIGEKIAQAIQYAIQTWKSEIISISFSCPSVKSARDAIRDATRNDIIVVCATGNSGNTKSTPFPAIEDRVFRIFSSSLDGKNAGHTATPDDHPYHFLALGSSVDSVWPSQLANKASRKGRHIFCTLPHHRDQSCHREPRSFLHDCDTRTFMSGTSLATPIAAALVSVFYQFDNIYGGDIEREARKEDEHAEKLKSITSVRRILTKLSSRLATDRRKLLQAPGRDRGGARFFHFSQRERGDERTAAFRKEFKEFFIRKLGEAVTDADAQ